VHHEAAARACIYRSRAAIQRRRRGPRAVLPLIIKQSGPAVRPRQWLGGISYVPFATWRQDASPKAWPRPKLKNRARSGTHHQRRDPAWQRRCSLPETGLDASIQHRRDAVITVAACAICGADVHRYGGITPAMERGDVRSFFDLIAVFGGAWPRRAMFK